jgi:hypothetical protein
LDTDSEIGFIAKFNKLSRNVLSIILDATCLAFEEILEFLRKFLWEKTQEYRGWYSRFVFRVMDCSVGNSIYE